MPGIAVVTRSFACLILVLSLGGQLVLPEVASAAGGLTVTEQVRDASLGQPFAGSTVANPGDTLQFLMVLTNTGSTPLTGLAASGNVVANETFLTNSCSAPCTYDPTGMTVTFNLGTTTLNAGQQIPLTYAVTVAPGTPTGTTLTNTATGSASGGVTATSSGVTTTVASTSGVCPAGYPGCYFPYPPCYTGCGYSPCYSGCPISPCYAGCAIPPCYSGCTYPVCGGIPSYYTPCSGLCGPAYPAYTINCTPYNYAPCAAYFCPAPYAPCAAPVYSPCAPCAAPVYSPCAPCAAPVYSPCAPCAAPVYSPCAPCAAPVYSPCAQPVYSPCPATCAQVAPVACGTVVTYAAPAGGTAGTMYMNGTTYTIPAGTSFGNVVVVPGSFYCFLVAQGNICTGVLSATVVAAHAVEARTELHRQGRRAAL